MPLKVLTQIMCDEPGCAVEVTFTEAVAKVRRLAEVVGWVESSPGVWVCGHHPSVVMRTAILQHLTATAVEAAISDFKRAIEDPRGEIQGVLSAMVQDGQLYLCQDRYGKLAWISSSYRR